MNRFERERERKRKVAAIAGVLGGDSKLHGLVAELVVDHEREILNVFEADPRPTVAEFIGQLRRTQSDAYRRGVADAQSGKPLRDPYWRDGGPVREKAS